MSADGKGPVSLTKLREAAKQLDEDQIAFKVIVYLDGRMEWKGPDVGDPLTNELLVRGWLDKVRETLLQAHPPPRIVT